MGTRTRLEEFANRVNSRVALMLGLCVAMFSCSSETTPPSVAGRWEGAWKTEDGSFSEKFSFQLQVDGQVIHGQGLDEKGVSAKVSGKINDSSLTLKISPENGEKPIQFTGRLEKDTLQGTWKVDAGTGSWSAVRK